MSAELLRRAAALMRQDAQMGRAWIGPWTVEAALAAADWLDNEALVWDRVGPSAGVAATAPAYALPVAVARAYLGEQP